MNDDKLVELAVQVILNGSNARPAENIYLPDGKYNNPDSIHNYEKLKKLISNWFIEFLSFQRVLPLNSSIGT